MNLEPAILEVRDRLEIADALYRFCAAIDFNNEALFVSVLAPDVIVDMAPGNKLWGLELPVFQGRNMVIQALRNSVGLLDTTHVVTNPRIEINGDIAKLYAIVEAQHLPPKWIVLKKRKTVFCRICCAARVIYVDGLPFFYVYVLNDHSCHCLMKNQYDVDLIRDGDRWLITHMLVDGVWFTGEPSILMS